MATISAATSQFPIATTTGLALSSVACVDDDFSFETTSQMTTAKDEDDLFTDKKKDAQDIVSALHGSFDFLQESEIDESGEQRPISISRICLRHVRWWRDLTQFCPYVVCGMS